MTQIQGPLRGGRNVSLILGMVAIILSAGALVSTIVVPGPTGPMGATGAAGASGAPGSTGPTGPVGNGTIESYVYDFGTTSIAGSCTHYALSDLNITVPGPGTVILYVSTTVSISHTNGQADIVYVYGGTPSNYCSHFAGGEIVLASSMPTGTSWLATSFAARVTVTSSGTYTYGIGGIVNSGAGTFEWASMSAVFYPS